MLIQLTYRNQPITHTIQPIVLQRVYYLIDLRLGSRVLLCHNQPYANLDELWRRTTFVWTRQASIPLYTPTYAAGLWRFEAEPSKNAWPSQNLYYPKQPLHQYLYIASHSCIHYNYSAGKRLTVLQLGSVAQTPKVKGMHYPFPMSAQ